MANIPTHIVYYVKDLGTPGKAEAPRAIWTRVSAAWQHGDARGLTIVLEAMPLNGQLVVRTAVQEDNQPEAPQDTPE